MMTLSKRWVKEQRKKGIDVRKHPAYNDFIDKESKKEREQAIDKL